MHIETTPRVGVLLRPFALAILLAPAVSALAAGEPGGPGDPEKPTVVLVHGAFAESSSWTAVVTQLRSQGFPVLAAANPLRDLESDTAAVAALVESVEGPVVLVGHSYGGMVITNVVQTTTNVEALVYVAGFAPEVGENAADLTDQFPGSTLDGALAPPVELRGGELDLYIRQDVFAAQFAADVDPARAELMGVTQRPIAASALEDNSAAAGWQSTPSFFVYGENDRNIPAAAHAFMAERAGARRTVMIEGASHVVMISHAEAVANLIIEAAAATMPTMPD